jgi:hypothetical protein
MPEENKTNSSTEQQNNLPSLPQTQPGSAQPETSTSQPNVTASQAPPIVQPTVVGSGFKPKKKLGLAMVVLIALVVLMGSSAAAYLAVIVPNKPENILKNAFENTLDQKKAKFDGKLSFESTDPSASLKAVNADINGQSDLEANAHEINFDISASGVKIPLETRFVDRAIYLKFGGLQSLTGLLSAGGPRYAAYADSIGKKLENQWIEVDETLLKQVGGGCALDISYNLSKEDKKLLLDQYEKHPFAKIKSKTDDTVNGKDAVKFELTIDAQQRNEFSRSLSELSVMQKIEACKKSEKLIGTDKQDNSQDGEITVWVDKSSKTITKLMTKTTPEQEASTKSRAALELTLTYGQAEVTKPSGAKPLMEVFGDLNSVLGAADTIVPAVMGNSTSR